MKIELNEIEISMIIGCLKTGKNAFANFPNMFKFKDDMEMKDWQNNLQSIIYKLEKFDTIGE